MSEYRFSTFFIDGQLMRRFELAQPITKYGDIEYVKARLDEIRERCPAFAKYIVETSRLIVEADGKD